ncbi:hypothetical protein BJ684DRAFT_15550 [Piptocephalis cylindrospora]|uniref:Uncharacterized protein n=1 Tax=Piptocephalis cylindrospora TaxID=1907219 RepID=A0A4P9Y540_9FUNG|nr:hypothetical protein BJ684DRAFT_15550 [Piptocephalis cylindrospora]|eukprot:RKP14106.1 hypothetical protein BJ684DRAFT_15550 [Piptocephalis cylindrospora]
MSISSKSASSAHLQTAPPIRQWEHSELVGKRPSTTALIDPTIIQLPQNPALPLQYSIHACPRSFRRTLQLIFPSLPSGPDAPTLHILPTFQPTSCPILSWTPEAAAEKDHLLLTFTTWANRLTLALHAEGHWADLTDPASGLPVHTQQGPSFYPDVEGAERLLRYATVDIGGCRLLEHPKWGSRVYPGTLFTTAPIRAVLSCMTELEVEGAQNESV